MRDKDRDNRTTEKQAKKDEQKDSANFISLKKTFLGSFTIQTGKWKQSIQLGINITFYPVIAGKTSNVLQSVTASALI